MKAVDTNILVRFLVKDDDAQARKVLGLFKQAEARKETFFVPLLVVLELVWVLESVYNCTRTEIIDAVETLAMMPVIRFEDVRIVHAVIEYGRSSGVDLADLLIGLVARRKGCDTVLSFDKHAAQSDLFVLV